MEPDDRGRRARSLIEKTLRRGRRAVTIRGPSSGIGHPSTKCLPPLSDSKRVHQISKEKAESLETRVLAGIQALSELINVDADSWGMASADLVH